MMVSPFLWVRIVGGRQTCRPFVVSGPATAVLFGVQLLQDVPGGRGAGPLPPALQARSAAGQLGIAQVAGCVLDLRAEDVPGGGGVDHGWAPKGGEGGDRC